MATPTFLQLVTDLKNAVNVFEKLRLFGETDSPNLIGLLDTYKDAVNTNFPGQRSAAVDLVRAQYSGILSRGTIRAFLDPIFRDFGKNIGAPEGTDTNTIVQTRLYQDFIDNPDTLNSREITFDTPLADGGNTGTGVIHRLSVDDRGFDIENVNPSLDVTARIRRDQNAGVTKNREVFELATTAPPRDNIDLSSGDLGISQNLVTRGQKNIMLQNSSFDIGGGTDAAPTSLPGWTLLDSGDNVLTVSSSLFTRETSSANTFLGKTRDSEVIRSLKIVTASQLKFQQKFSLRGISYPSAEVPLFLSIAYNRSVFSGAGTLIISKGSKSETVVLAAQTGWNRLFLALGTKNWLFNTTEDDLDILVDWSPTGGSLLIDDVSLAPFIPFAGHWYYSDPGKTAFLYDDKFTWADSVATEGIIQQYLWRGGYGYLPSATAGGESITDPS